MGAPNGEPSGHPTSPANRLVAQLSQSQQANQLKWISNDSPEKCIDLQSIVPDKIPITSTGKVSDAREATRRPTNKPEPLREARMLIRLVRDSREFRVSLALIMIDRLRDPTQARRLSQSESSPLKILNITSM